MKNGCDVCEIMAQDPEASLSVMRQTLEFIGTVEAGNLTKIQGLLLTMASGMYTFEEMLTPVMKLGLLAHITHVCAEALHLTKGDLLTDLADVEGVRH